MSVLDYSLWMMLSAETVFKAIAEAGGVVAVVVVVVLAVVVVVVAAVVVVVIEASRLRG